MLCFRRDDVFASKIANIEIWNRTTKTIQNIIKIRVHAT